MIGSAGEGLRVGDRAPELEITGAGRRARAAARPRRQPRAPGGPARAARSGSTSGPAGARPARPRRRPIRDTAAAYAPQGLAVVGISVQEATEDDVRAYAEKYGLAYTVAADLTGDVFRRYRVFGLPTQYFLDENGVIRSIVQGPVTPESVASNLALLGLEAPASLPSSSPSAFPSDTP